MGVGWRWLGTIWVYWMILGLHLLAILFFTKGFLLTRTELPYYSNCSDVTQSPCFFTSHIDDANLNQTHHHCWTKPAVTRVIIIVLDALRLACRNKRLGIVNYVPENSLHTDDNFKLVSESKPWMDKLQVLQELASQNPSSARIFKAIADPPTTSLQRLKGLTTGGLPTFIDVGNSFGAPAIIEDNLIHQLVQNGKRVTMMGDDTWMQLFPHHFEKSHPFPSFNVKDLHTVDNGCIDHLLPSLYQEDWDVLIAHFLGVDHAGHIYGVESVQMIDKLEQYNVVLRKVIEVLKNESEPGGLHENTLLFVMGDHGQTLNGDHGGGTPEEVETSIFAMSFKKPPASIPSTSSTSSCELKSDEKNLCINSVQQLDFAVTVSALLGIPFPFGSIGHVNLDLYALGAGGRSFNGDVEFCEYQSELGEWMWHYVNALCINSWQVKRYMDIYSASSVIGFSGEDLFHVADLHAKAVEKWSYTKNFFVNKNESCNTVLPALKSQIDAYSNFLSSVKELARSKWTEFNLKTMAVGFGIMLLSIFIHMLALTEVKKKNGISFSPSQDSGISFGLFCACFMVAIRAFSFFSNSYILEEGKVACFLLATSAVAKLRNSVLKKKLILQVFVFLLVIIIGRFTIEVGLSKQTPDFDFLNIFPSWMPRIAFGLPVLSFVTDVVPVICLMLLAIFLYKTLSSSISEGLWKYVIRATILSYMLIAVHWASESNLCGLAWVFKGIGRNLIPQMVYALGFTQLLLLICRQSSKEGSLYSSKSFITKAVALLSTCSSTIIMLLGKQGPVVSIAAIFGGYCIVKLDHNANNEGTRNVNIDPLSVTQWSLLAVCLFFCTGHWCAFDGLRYGAAFIGFDDFILIRQAILLTIDTFGLSLILPIFGLPFLVGCNHSTSLTGEGKNAIFASLSLVYLMYGLIMATTVTVTMICVTIHRRHLMVWGLFAPKFVFDVVGLLLTDILICLASLYYFGKNCRQQDHTTENLSVS
ncbi:uncharacterized protein LOC115725084 isoform X1 [Cannabis sativa]|uniref:uncharacterized protein LOC115725084 isoform X1 n=2 Tax=Cannabis sativa TaxID=3483 RepID=UPI0029C9F0F8|nr:uncharacterized protein LOC115725084 isoform X1 [Cannabis sativa]